MKESFVTVIMAAGLGKRMHSELPKVLHRVNRRPLVHYVINLARSVGSGRILLVVGHGREQVIDATRELGVEWVVQPVPLGTADAVKSCQQSLEGYNGDVLILSGDVPLLRRQTVVEALEVHRRSGAAATVFTFQPPDPGGYGRIIRGRDDELLRIAEQKDASLDQLQIGEVNGGAYFYRAEALFRALENISFRTATGEYYLTETISILAGWGERLSAFLVEDPLELVGVNNLEQLNELEQELTRRMTPKVLTKAR